MKTFCNPLLLFAIFLTVFATICVAELLIEFDAPANYLVMQTLLICLLALATCVCWRAARRINGVESVKHFAKRVLPFVAATYVVGYFALMDRTIPILTGPAGVVDHQSSFRFCPPMAPTSLPMVTIWNFVYDPMDLVYFRYFPRSADETARLKEEGLL